MSRPRIGATDAGAGVADLVSGAGRRWPGSSNPSFCSSPRTSSLLEEDLLQKEAELEAQLQEKDRKLKAASKALNRSRNQVRQLTAQLALKEVETNRLETKSSSLQEMLELKEEKLRQVTRELEKAVKLAEANILRATIEQAKLLPQESPNFPPELTTTSNPDEVDLQRRVEAVTTLLHAERQRRLQNEEDFAATCAQREEQMIRLFACLEEKDREIEALRRGNIEREERKAREETVQEVLASKGRQLHPLLEV